MPVKAILKEHEESMKKAISYLEDEFKGVRTGRASTGIVDNLKVEYYGNLTPIKQLATIAAPDATSIIIKPFDTSCCGAIEKAIKSSDLGLNPISDGKSLRLPIPPMSEERRKQIAQQVKQMGEQQKIALRNIRRDANKAFDDEQKGKIITEDDRDGGKKDMDDMIKKYSDMIDVDVKKKMAEVMEA